MNRRDFLGLFRGLAILPFVKPFDGAQDVLPELPTATDDKHIAKWTVERVTNHPSPDTMILTSDWPHDELLDRKFYSLLNLDTLPGDYSYSLSISPLHDTFDFSSETPLDTVYQEGDFISVWVDGRLLREGYVQAVSKYGFTLVSPFAS